MSKLFAPIICLVLALLIIFYFGGAVLNGSDNSALSKYFLNGTGKGLRILLAEKDEYNRALDHARKVEEKVKELEEARQSISVEERQKLDEFIPDRIDTVDFVVNINRIAARHGMILKGVKIEEKTTAIPTTARAIAQQGAAATSTIDSTGMKFSVSGPYNSLLGFLDNLAISLRVADVESVSFVSDEKGLNRYDIELKTYWVK